LKDVRELKVESVDDLDKIKDEVLLAYKKAEAYLERVERR
jgi:hypothetical protein